MLIFSLEKSVHCFICGILKILHIVVTLKCVCEM